jgi:hypothetical protein
MITVTIRANSCGRLRVGNIMPLMTLKTHCLDLLAFKDDVRRRCANVLIVGVPGA